MAEQANTTTTTEQGATATGASTTTAAPSSPSTFTVPAGYRLIPESEHAQFARNTERLRGTDGFFNEAKKHGIKDFSELNDYLPLVGGLRSSKADIKAIEAALLRKEAASDGQDQGRGNGRTSDFDPEKFRSEIVGEVKREAAMERHSALTAKEPEMIASAAKELAGPKASAYELKQAERAIKAELNDSRPLYPEGHPLADSQFAPLTPDHVKKVLDAIKKEQADAKAASIVAKADSIRKTPVASPTAAGNPGSQGGPQDKPLNNRDWLASRARVHTGE